MFWCLPSAGRGWPGIRLGPLRPPGRRRLGHPALPGRPPADTAHLSVAYGPAGRRGPGALLAGPLPCPPAPPEDHPRRSQGLYQARSSPGGAAGGKYVYLLSESWGGRISQADQGLKPDHVVVIAGPPLAQDLNSALSLPGMQDAPAQASTTASPDGGDRLTLPSITSSTTATIAASSV